MGISAFDLSVLAGKTAIVMIVLLALYRLLGKRNLSQFNAYDFVTVMAVANAVQNGMTSGRGELAVGLVCSSALVVTAYLLTRLAVRSTRAARVLSGDPVLLVNEGNVMEDRLAREHVSRDDLMAAVRAHGLHELDAVAMAVLEVDGSISVVPRSHRSRLGIAQL